MPALSFKREWIDALLTGDKLQTTRKPRLGKPSVTVGDHVHVYVEQRGKIDSKPVYPTTPNGAFLIHQKILDGKYPNPVAGIAQRIDLDFYYAHYLGIVIVSAVETIHPSEMTSDELEDWAWRDGFRDFDEGDLWFIRHHSDISWSMQAWDVIRWTEWETLHYLPRK